MTSMRAIHAFAVILTLMVVPVQAVARKYSNVPVVDMEIVSDRRGPLREYSTRSEHDTIQRSYIMAKNDERYRIKVSNRSNRRVGLVIAVDGRNIISGKKSYLQSDERMYLLEPFQTQEIEGWRTGRNRTHRFYFTDMDESYSADWGDYSAMGVVALAVFSERHQRVNRPGYNGMKRNKMAAGSKSLQREPGTGFGEQQWSPSREVRFVAEKRASSKEFIKYEYRSTLCQRGIVRCRENHRKNRFWDEDERNYGYAPFPSWYLNLRF